MWLLLSSLGAALFVTGPARAQSVERPYLSLDATLLEIDSTKLSLSEEDLDDAPEIERSTTTVGLLGSGIGVGVGVGVSDNVVLGGQLRLTSQTQKIENETSIETGSFTLLPRVEYVFSTSGAARPFLVGLVGLQSVTVKTFDEDVDFGTIELETKESRTLFGVGFGAHLFAAPSFSIDPMLSLAVFNGTRTTSISASDFDDDEEELTIGGTVVLVTVGLTGWLGGTPQKAAAAPPPATESAGGWTESPRPSAPSDDELSAVPPVKTNQLLEGNRVLFLKGRPESLRSAVMFRMADAPGGQSLGTCRDVAVVAGETRLPARNLRLLGNRAAGNELRGMAEGLFDSSAIDLLSRDPNAAIVACGDRWQLTEAARQGLVTFLVEFRRRGGAPAEPPSEPLPAPVEAPLAPEPAPDPSAPTPPPAAPGTPPPAAPGAPPPAAPAPPKASFESPTPVAPPPAPAPKAPAKPAR